MKFLLAHILHSDIIFTFQYRIQVDTACLYIGIFCGNSGLIIQNTASISDCHPVAEKFKSGIVGDIIPQRSFGSNGGYLISVSIEAYKSAILPQLIQR